MDSESSLITVVDGNESVESRRCRLVPLPDGTKGALWRGLVWPIAIGSTIDVAGPAFSLLPQDPPVGPRFGLVDGAEEAWLVLEGSVTVRDAVAGALRQAGIETLRSGPWLGDPVDGVVGSSFIRFVRPAVGDLRETIAYLLRDFVSTAAANDDDSEERARILAIELIEARSQLARLKTRPQDRASEPTAVPAELARLRQENTALLQEIADLSRQIAERPPVRSHPNRAAGRLLDEIAALLGKFRPDLRFLRDSLTIVTGEYADRQSFYSAVNELGPDPLRRGWKKIHGTPGWWERHISNGQDDSGRIYARPTAGKWEVLVSHKAQQRRDIEWLAGLPFPDRI